MPPHPLRARQTLTAGRSYWQVILDTGRIYSELDMVKETRHITFADEQSWNEFKRRKRMRPLDWYLDIAAMGDTAHIAELWLHSPKGPVALKITQPNSAYILNTNIGTILYGNDHVAQAIGRVDNRDTGIGVAFIWDAAIQQMFKDEQASVKSFSAWRPGICAPGALNVAAMGVKL